MTELSIPSDSAAPATGADAVIAVAIAPAQASDPLADPTLDELRLLLAPHVAENAAFDGWSMAAIDAAADMIGVDRDVARLAMANGGTSASQMDMIDAWIDWIDSEMTAALPADLLAHLKIRERIRRLVETRIDLMAPNREALARALAIEAMPHHAARALRRGWRSADIMWRLAGDAATDYNHYTKRLTLGSLYAATLAVMTQDQSNDFADTRAFLGRRIDDVMRFEKAKYQFLGRTRNRPSLARFVGRLRYPSV